MSARVQAGVPRNCSSPNMPFPQALRWDTHPITASRAAHSRAGGGLGRTTTSEAQKLVRTAYPTNPGRGEAAPPHSLCPEGLQRCAQTQLTPPKRAPHKSPSDWYVCVCAHTCVCMCACMWGHACAHVCIHGSICIRVCPYMCAPTHVCTCVRVCVARVRVHGSVCICVHPYMCVRVWSHVCVHVHGIRLAFPKVIPTGAK